jgi:ABC-type uncharacterized transport system substrate-binding protein
MMFSKVGTVICAIGAAVMMMAVHPQGAKAHPHVWVTVETAVETAPNHDITGFRQHWAFDDYYTAFALQGMDTDGDGKYSDAELKPLAEVNIHSLHEFGFFTFPKLGEKKLPLKEPVEYRLDYTDNILVLTFLLPLEKPISAAEVKNLTFAVYDPTFYIAFSFADLNPVKMAAGEAAPCQPVVGKRGNRSEVALGGSIGENFNPSANIGADFAQTVTFKCR